MDPSPGREGKKGIPDRRPNTCKSAEVGCAQGYSMTGEEGLRMRSECWTGWETKLVGQVWGVGVKGPAGSKCSIISIRKSC